MPGLLIGDVAARAGVPASTIRYYERLGLLARANRSEAGYRQYSEKTIDELGFIRKAQALGFSLDETGEILKLTRSGQAPCAQVLSMAHAHLEAVRDRIRQLQKFETQLSAELGKWDGQVTPTCQGFCQIIQNAEVESCDG